jgi:DNA-directed RNA polymerase subunit N (RpoN/RPB10)
MTDERHPLQRESNCIQMNAQPHPKRLKWMASNLGTKRLCCQREALEAQICIENLHVLAIM